MASEHQAHVARYHAAMARQAHHGAHDMYLFHRRWHETNPDPVLPDRPDRDWGMNLPFGTNFLQMHREMLSAAPGEPRQHMRHDSLLAWYAAKSIAAPAAWNPLDPIPRELGYEPDPSVFPESIQSELRLRAQRRGMSVTELLRRKTDHPAYELPRWFSREGSGANDPSEPITGSRKLADFKNANQLGCCLVFPHNTWHVGIGGAMASTLTAIADPIFYFGVHWAVDKIYGDFLAIESARSHSPADPQRLEEAFANPTASIELADEFSDTQRMWLDVQAAISERLRE